MSLEVVLLLQNTVYSVHFLFAVFLHLTGLKNVCTCHRIALRNWDTKVFCCIFATEPLLCGQFLASACTRHKTVYSKSLAVLALLQAQKHHRFSIFSNSIAMVSPCEARKLGRCADIFQLCLACVAGVQRGGRGEVECEREARSLGTRMERLP